MKRFERLVLTSSGSWHETYIMCSSHEVYDTQKTSISKFRLLAEKDGGEQWRFEDESSLQGSIYVVYTRKQGRIILEDESASFSRGLLYWEEGERIGNFLYFSKSDTDYDVLSATASGKTAMKLIHHVFEILTPALSGGTLENHAAQALILEGDDVDESTEPETVA